MSSVIKPNTTMGIIKVLLDNRVKDKKMVFGFD